MERPFCFYWAFQESRKGLSKVSNGPFKNLERAFQNDKAVQTPLFTKSREGQGLAVFLYFLIFLVNAWIVPEERLN